jgi:hypothetical protein
MGKKLCLVYIFLAGNIFYRSLVGFGFKESSLEFGLRSLNTDVLKRECVVDLRRIEKKIFMDLYYRSKIYGLTTFDSLSPSSFCIDSETHIVGYNCAEYTHWKLFFPERKLLHSKFFGTVSFYRS